MNIPKVVEDAYKQAVRDAESSGEGPLELITTIHRIDEEHGWDGQSYVNLPAIDPVSYDRPACPECGSQRWRWFQRAICERYWFMDLDEDEPWYTLDEDGWEYIDDVTPQPSSADDPVVPDGYWACIEGHKLEADDPIGERLDKVVYQIQEEGRAE